MRRRLAAASLAVVSALPLAAQEVTLPLAKFEELRAKANPQPDKPPVPPAPFALESAGLALEVSGASARLTTTLVLTLYADGWQTVPVGEAGSFVAADWGRLEGRLDVVKDRGWVLVVRGKGRQTVRLTSVAEVHRDETAIRPTRRIDVTVPGAALVTGTVAVPADVEEVTLTGPGLLEPAGDGRWSFLAAPRAALSIVLTGKRTTPERALLPLRFEATTAVGVKLSRTRLAVEGGIEVRVAQGRLAEVKVPVPEGFQVVAARGASAAIAGWNVADGRLVVTPLEPIEGSLQIEVELTGEPRDSFAAPLLLVEGSTRTMLYAKASLSGDGLLALADPGAVRPAEEREAQRLPRAVAAVPGPLLAVTDPARPPRWQAEWAEKTEVLAAQIDRLVVDVAAGDSGRAVYQLWAEVRNRGAQQLTFAMPSGFELVVARRDGLAVAPGTAADGKLAVPLASGEAAQLVHLQGHLPLAVPAREGDLAVPLPDLSAPAAQIEMRVVLPGGRSYALAQPSRLGRVSVPQTRGARQNVSRLAQQVNLYRAAETVAGPSFLSAPAGFGVLEATWSALSIHPGPLVIRVSPYSERPQWF